MEWSSDMSIQLIQQYQARPELWDVTHEMYRVQSKKYETWRELAALFECDIADVRKKLNSLFASYRREKIRVRQGLKSTWFLYNYLSFLPSHVDDSANRVTQKRSSSYKPKVKQQPPSPEQQEDDDDDGGVADEGEGEDDEIPEIEALDEDMETVREHILIKGEPVPVAFSNRKPQRSRPISRPVRNRRPIRPVSASSSAHGQLSNRLSEALRLLKRSETFRQKDECDSFGEYIADSLRKHDERTQSMIKQAINNILFEQEMKKYSLNQQFTVMIANPDENPLILDESDK